MRWTNKKLERARAKWHDKNVFSFSLDLDGESIDVDESDWRQTYRYGKSNVLKQLYSKLRDLGRCEAFFYANREQSKSPHFSFSWEKRIFNQAA